MKNIEEAFDLNKEIPLADTLNKVIEDAWNKNASHILIEPDKDSEKSTIYYIINSKLVAQFHYFSQWYISLKGRIKLIGQLNIAERQKIQNGAGKYENDNWIYDMLISTIPFEDIKITPMNESLVIAFKHSLDLKFPAEDETIVRIIKELHGDNILKEE